MILTLDRSPVTFICIFQLLLLFFFIFIYSFVYFIWFASCLTSGWSPYQQNIGEKDYLGLSQIATWILLSFLFNPFWAKTRHELLFSNLLAFFFFKSSVNVHWHETQRQITRLTSLGISPTTIFIDWVANIFLPNIDRPHHWLASNKISPCWKSQ